MPNGFHRMTAAEAEAARIDAQLHFPVRLRELYKEFHVRPGEEIGGRPTVMVSAKASGRPDLSLYFDHENGLLLRLIRFAETPLGRNPTQIDYADFRVADGVKIPYKWTLTRPGGSFTIQIEQVQQNVPVDEKLFVDAQRAAQPIACIKCRDFLAIGKNEKEPQSPVALSISPRNSSSEPENEAAHEIAAVQKIPDLCVIAAKERIAILPDGRATVRRHKSNITAQANVAVEVILHAAANAVGKRGAIRGGARRGHSFSGGQAAVGIVGEAQAGGNVRAQSVLAIAKHIESTKLELVDVRVVGLEILQRGDVAGTVGGVVAVPHEFELGIFRQVVAQERAVG